MRNLIIVFAFLILPSCGFVRGMQQNIETVTEVLGQVQTVVAEIQEAKAAADTDGDGKTSTDEWMKYLWGLLLPGGWAAAKMKNNASNLAQRNASSDERKSKIESRIDSLEAKG